MFENSHSHIYTIVWARNFCQKNVVDMLLKGYGISFFKTSYTCNAFSGNLCIAILEDPVLLNTIPK